MDNLNKNLLVSACGVRNNAALIQLEAKNIENCLLDREHIIEDTLQLQHRLPVQTLPGYSMMMPADTNAPSPPEPHVPAVNTSSDTQISPVDLTICHLKGESNFQNFRDIAAAIKDIHGAGGTKLLGDIDISAQECARRWQDTRPKFEAQTNVNGEKAQYVLTDIIKAAIEAYDERHLCDITHLVNLRLEALGRKSECVDVNEVLHTIQQKHLTAALNRGGSKRELIQTAMASCEKMNEARKWWSITNSVNFALRQFDRSIMLLEVRMLSGDDNYDPASEDAKLSSFEDPAVAVSIAARKIRDLRKEKDELVEENERLQSEKAIADLREKNAKLLARTERLERSLEVFAPAGMRPDFGREET